MNMPGRKEQQFKGQGIKSHHLLGEKLDWLLFCVLKFHGAV